MIEKDDVILTIYTPTYNRATLIGRVYESLKKQTDKRFIWLIIDDGSTDNTREIVEEWIKNEKSFQIDYYYKNNGGIHTARDAAFKLCNTELIVGVDSDDWLLPFAVEKILSIWKLNEKDNIGGIFAPSIYEDGTLIGSRIPPTLKYCSNQEFLYKYKLKSDTVNVLKTDMMKKIPDAPVFSGEKLIGEGYKMIQIPEDMVFVIYDEALQVKEYQNDGYTVNAYGGIFNNPKGFREDYKMHMQCGRFIVPKMRGILGYNVCSMILKDGGYIRKSPCKVLTILFTPLSTLAYLYILWRRTRKINQPIV